MHSHWAEGSRNMNSGQLLEQAWVRLQRYLAPQKTAAKIGPTQPLCQSAGGGLRQFFARIPPGSPSGKYWAKRQRPSRASFGSRIGGGFLKEKGYSTLSFVQKFNFIIVQISFAKKIGENVGKTFCFWWENVPLSFLSQNFWERTAWVTWAFYSAIYWHVPGLGFGAFGRVLRSCCMSMAGYIGSLLALLRKRSLKKRIKSFQEFDPLIVFLKSVKNSTKFFAKKVPRKIPPNCLGIKSEMEQYFIFWCNIDSFSDVRMF